MKRLVKHRKAHLTPVQKVLLGKGPHRTFNGVGSDPRTQNETKASRGR